MFIVLVVFDVSMDKGVVYLVIFGFVLLYFELNEDMGVLKMVVVFDWEKYGMYELMIEVRNKEEILCYCYLFLIIKIVDEDDLYFDFFRLVYSVSVLENS